MKFEYYSETDTLYIDLNNLKSADSREIANGILLDFDENGILTGIEIDNAKKIIDFSKLETKSLPLKDLILA